MTIFTPSNSTAHNTSTDADVILFIKGIVAMQNMYTIADNVFNTDNANNAVLVIRESGIEDVPVLDADNVHDTNMPANALRFYVSKSVYVDNASDSSEFFRYELVCEKVVATRDSDSNITVCNASNDANSNMSKVMLASRNEDYAIERSFAALEISNILRFADLDDNVGDAENIDGINSAA